MKPIIFSMAGIGIFCLAGCGPTLDEGEDARIRVTPSKQIAFSRVAVGEKRALPFVITSAGRDALNVRKIEWQGPDCVSLQMSGDELPRLLPNQASMPVSVDFQPTFQQPSPKGTIKIYSNDPDKPVYSLDVAAQELAPKIHVSPTKEEKLIIGQTDVGAMTSKIVQVSNVGDIPLNLSDIRLDASPDFSYTLPDDAKLPLNLPADSKTALKVRVAFAPSSLGLQEASLAFVSSDPENPTYALPIVANSDSPCLLIKPSILEFPAVSIGTSKTQTVQLTSCSDVPLVIHGIEKVSGDSAFSLEFSDSEREITRGESVAVKVTFSPEKEGSFQASYVVMNNDPLQANATFSAMAQASLNQCPTAVARARLSSATNWEKKLALAPLDTIILDASESYDKESSTLQYYWTVTSAPRDSTSALVANGSQASFFLDLAGDYEICLNVEDTGNMMSCNTDCVTVSATPKETIHVQLVWNTPADTNKSDGDGADLDIHFLSLPDGKWGDTGNAQLNNGSDVFFLNRDPAWTTAAGIEYPSLDRDEKDGEGPENVNLDKPGACRWYAVGVHYYQDNAFGPSYATVRIYIDGKGRFEKSQLSLAQTGAFKQVAWIFYDGARAYFYDSSFAVSRDEDWKGMTPSVPDDIMARAKISAPSCFP